MSNRYHIKADGNKVSMRVYTHKQMEAINMAKKVNRSNEVSIKLSKRDIQIMRKVVKNIKLNNEQLTQAFVSKMLRGVASQIKEYEKNR